MKDDNNRKNLTEPFDDGMADDLQDALTQADDVIEQALRRKELEDAIAETDREVAELAAKRKKDRPQEDHLENTPADPAAPAMNANS